jgi:radial spoke head protein 4/6
VVTEHQALRQAGVSIGETNAHHLRSAIKALAIEHQTTSIRFWGKILGYKDYWVVQGVSSKPYLSDLPENSEAYGVGVNTYSYWTTTDLLGSWVELPLVTPEQVAGSRSFKYIFTGNLEGLVSKSHLFQGQEKHLVTIVLFS